MCFNLFISLHIFVIPVTYGKSNTSCRCNLFFARNGVTFFRVSATELVCGRLQSYFFAPFFLYIVVFPFFSYRKTTSFFGSVLFPSSSAAITSSAAFSPIFPFCNRLSTQKRQSVLDCRLGIQLEVALIIVAGEVAVAILGLVLIVPHPVGPPVRRVAGGGTRFAVLRLPVRSVVANVLRPLEGGRLAGRPGVGRGLPGFPLACRRGVPMAFRPSDACPSPAASPGCWPYWADCPFAPALYGRRACG